MGKILKGSEKHTYFPLLVRWFDSGEIEVIDKNHSPEIGRSFMILKTRVNEECRALTCQLSEIYRKIVESK